MSLHTSLNFWFAENCTHSQMEESHTFYVWTWIIGQPRDLIGGFKLKTEMLFIFTLIPGYANFNFFVTQSIYLNSFWYSNCLAFFFIQYFSYTLIMSLISLIKPLLTWLIQHVTG